MAKLLPHFKRQVRTYHLIPSKGGRFEVLVGDRLLYSKLATGKFPDEDAILRAIGEALGT